MTEPSFFQRLKERKLVRWTVGYLVFAAGVIGVMEGVQEPLSISLRSQQVVLVILIGGLLLTLILAWHHGEKGRQKVSGWEALMVGGLLVAVAAVVAKVGTLEEPSTRPFVLPGAEGIPRLAVLPLDDLSPDTTFGIFARGLEGSLRDRLAALPTLSVIGRTSVEQYRDPSERPSTQQIAAVLSADVLLEGDVEVTGDSVRVSVALIDGQRDTYSWQGDFGAPFTAGDYNGIQAQVVQQIAHALRAAISPEDLAALEAVPTGSLEALAYYINGREAFFQERKEGWEQDTYPSREWFQRAIDADPDFALAHAALALTLSWDGPYDQARRSADRALALFPTLPDAQVALARVKYFSGQYEEAQRDLEAIEKGFPNNTWATLFLASFQEATLKFEKSFESYRKAVAQDPRNPLIWRNLQYSFIRAHRFDEALEANATMASLLESIDGMNTLRRAFIHYAIGDRRRAERAVSELISIPGGAPYAVPPYYPFRVVERLLDVGDREIAFAVMDSDPIAWKDLDRHANRAIHESAMGNDGEARVYWDLVRVDLGEKSLEDLSFWNLSYLPLAHLGLGDEDAALETARFMRGKFARLGCRGGGDTHRYACEFHARILAQVGEREEAINILEEILPPPSWTTVHLLRIDPIWDPLRDHPRFRALLEEYADDVEH